MCQKLKPIGLCNFNIQNEARQDTLQCDILISMDIVILLVLMSDSGLITPM